jgi:hypothetical protein
MIFHATHDNWRAIEIFGRGTQKGMERLAQTEIAQKGNSTFG